MEQDTATATAGTYVFLGSCQLNSQLLLVDAVADSQPAQQASASVLDAAVIKSLAPARYAAFCAFFVRMVLTCTSCAQSAHLSLTSAVGRNAGA